MEAAHRVRSTEALRRDRSVRFAAVAVAAESAVFVANDGVCPVTPLTERLGAASGGVSDIFLPDVVARTIPIWSTALLVVAALLHARVLLRSRRPSRARAQSRRLSAGRGGTRGDAGPG